MDRPNHKYIRKIKVGNKYRYIYKESYIDKQIKKYADKIRNNEFESMYVFDKNGNLLFKERGIEEEVNVSEENEDLFDEYAAITLHNHPDIGRSFSAADVGQAIFNDLKRIDVAGKYYDYTMKFNWKKIKEQFGKNKWNFINFIDDTLDKIEDVYFDRYTELAKKGKISEDEANLLLHHTMWKIMSSKVPGWTYKRKEVKKFAPRT